MKTSVSALDVDGEEDNKERFTVRLLIEENLMDLRLQHAMFKVYVILSKLIMIIIQTLKKILKIKLCYIKIMSKYFN